MAKEVEVSAGALAIKPNQTQFDEFQNAALEQIGLKDASNADKAVFLHYCQRTGLDPFARQIYMIARQGKQTIQTGIDGFRIIALRSRKYRGQTPVQWCGEDGEWVDVWLSKEKPSAARVGVKHADFDEPMYAVALWSSYVGLKGDGSLTSMWSIHGPGQLAKCAEALALRKAFPNDLSGIYTHDEMESTDTIEGSVVEEKPKMVESEPFTGYVWTDEEIDWAMHLSDCIVEFKDVTSLQAWYKSEAVSPLHDTPFGSPATTVKEMTKAHLLTLRSEETK
jgi:phage recombination protein Bet